MALPPPSLVIGDPNNPYMLRWHLLKLGKLPRIYLHKFLRSDDDRAPHDHPWWFISILLWGTYLEYRWFGDQVIRSVRQAPSIAFRSLSTKHRVELIEGRPCWTLIITGPQVKEWGFQGCGE